MPCSKCTDVFKIEAKPAKIYFVSEVEELEAVLKQFFSNLGIILKDDNGANFVDGLSTFFYTTS